jgi:hypothetical protein
MSSLVNTYWRHKKRGTTYRVVIDYRFEFDKLVDGEDGFAVLHAGGGSILPTLDGYDLWDAVMVLPVSVQMSHDPGSNGPFLAQWIVYQSLDGEKQGTLYARPAGEFVDGRFLQCTAEEAGA